MSDYIRLAEAPVWCIQYPTCSACCVELDTEGDDWMCPSCGTSWDIRAGDGDKGTLYADWAGEESTGPVASEDDARRWGDYLTRLARHKSLPELCPAPTRPTFVTSGAGS